MTWVNTMHQAINRLDKLPVLRNISQSAHRQRFLKNVDQNLFMGVYDTFEAAAASAPPSLHLGYDNEESANIAYVSAISPRDYPAMFWLLRSLGDGMRTFFDLGGHTGVKYYAFRRAIGFPPDIRWTVCDVPAVVVRGRELAQARAPEGSLHFTDRYEDLDGQDVLFASGSLQYLPLTLSDMLKGLRRMPRRVVVNTTPIHETQSFFTLNSIGTAFCPYRVQARETFVESVTALGYLKRDAWDNLGKGMVIPDAQGMDVESYSGFCFDLKD